jgi:hypothetical protein
MYTPNITICKHSGMVIFLLGRAGRASCSSSFVFSVVKPVVIHKLLGVVLTWITVTRYQSIL